jgi:hypothetical protein
MVLVVAGASACGLTEKWRSACSSQIQQGLRDELLAVGHALDVQWKPVVSCDADDEALFVENEEAGGSPTQAVAGKVAAALIARGWSLQHPATTTGSVADIGATVACLERTTHDGREFAQLYASSPTILRMVHPADPKAEYCRH